MSIATLLKSINVGGKEFLLNKDLGIAPYFTFLIRKRIRQKKTCNIAVTGEAGDGKSYTGNQVATHLYKGWGSLDDKYAKKDPDFGLPGVVYGYNAYLKILLEVGMGYPIVFDEPSYAMGKREWYKQINQALVKTVESARSMVKPLIIPIINSSLLDKTIRSYLIQFMIVMHDRGKGVVYRIQPSQFQDKVYRKFICRIRYGMMENDRCNKDSCLGCKDIQGCQLLRARYEKKKASIMHSRYEQDLVETERMETSILTLKQLENIVFPHYKEFSKDRTLSVLLMQTVLREKLGIRIGRNKAYELGSSIKYNHQELFDQE